MSFNTFAVCTYTPTQGLCVTLATPVAALHNLAGCVNILQSDGTEFISQLPPAAGDALQSSANKHTHTHPLNLTLLRIM